MVKIIEAAPDPKIVKRTSCTHCAVKLEYLPIEVRNRKVSCMGDIDTYHYIICPNCGKDTSAARIWND